MKTVIVTGGAKGIGKAIIEELAKENYQIILNYRFSEKEAIKMQKQLIQKGYKIEIYQADVSIRQQAKGLVEFAKEKFGTVDILINNAGISKIKLFTEITDQEWHQMIQNNLTSVFYMTQEVVKDMITKKQGCIINISSIWGITGGSCEVPYSVSKAGIDGMTKSLAKELGPSNIRVNSIAPGIIMTDMDKNLTLEEIQEIKEQIPLRKIGKTQDVAKCVKWLIEDEYTTGQIISPNGGWVI